MTANPIDQVAEVAEVAPVAKEYRIGVDLGGTKLAVAVVDSQGEICGDSVTYDHKNLTEEQVLDCIERNIDAAIQDVVARHSASGKPVAIENVRGKIKGIGLLFPGHIQWPEGRTLTTSNLPGFRDFPLRERMQERTGLPCVADNDANGQTLAEYLYGAGKGIDPLVFMTVSTGIGGGIIIDGKLYRGFTGTAGEFGHMIVDASSDRRCTCGNYGCLMGVASGIVLPEVARRLATELADEGECLKLPRGCDDFTLMDGAMLAAGCAEKNELCMALVDDFARYIGIGLYNIFQILNPMGVVLGGGLMNLPDFFFDKVMSTCYERAGLMMHDHMLIRKGTLGPKAGVLGAAALVGLVTC